ncbi:PE family protein [Mycobacterium intermedium]|uniref:PE family protein n=1 Tax=Mycobacterium intermedium TaxID=28445 RepID=A0A1E3SMU0_MYCIE|nr:PE family protein [Mycobacterium intermedium]MCV6967082.1 PE family protein [Mycobacterium intermedium]ODR03470.1 hypothetical protein BHQ20_00650 [Mycobacterium intermedium]OPE53002.1 PE family protein [Mycobacterium intermedium]ORB07734.1 PE family protein [Mycobacterium intermedium]
MSFVIAAPELVEAAAQQLAGIQSALAEVTAAAAAPTTGILSAGADEVSAAIAQAFGLHGQEFQALSAQAAAFHSEFVGMLNAGASAYASAEASAQSLLSPPAQALVDGIVAPYQALVANTTANLQTLGAQISANPAPILQQLMINQSAYAQAIQTGFQSAVQNLPAEVANLPASIQAGVQGLLSANPGAVVQGIINNQIGYAQLIAGSLQKAGSDLVTGFQALPASFQAASQAFAAGDVTGGLLQIGGGFLNPFFSGFNVVTGADGVLTITPVGALGDLLPILSIPGQMAQNFTNLLPAGSIPAQMAQNFTNVVKTLTDASVTSSASLVIDGSPPAGFSLDLNTHMGLPLALAIGAIGGPANALHALGSSATAFVNAAQSGNAIGAATALLDAPAAATNAFLNGQITVPLQLTALGFPTTLNLPLSGILVNPTAYTGSADLGGGLLAPATVTGTPLGGIVSGLLNFLPQSIGAALGGPVPVMIPPVAQPL